MDKIKAELTISNNEFSSIKGRSFEEMLEENKRKQDVFIKHLASILNKHSIMKLNQD